MSDLKIELTQENKSLKRGLKLSKKKGFLQEIKIKQQKQIIVQSQVILKQKSTFINRQLYC